MQFSQILRSMVEDDGRWRADVPDLWTQGRTVFGGLQAALLLRAMRTVLPAPLPLKVIQTAFVAPVPAGIVRLSARVLRVGKSVTQIEARIVDGDATAALAVGIFGANRPSRIHVAPPRAPDPPGEPLNIAFVPGLSPKFLQHFDLRWLEGALLYTGSTSTRAVMGIGMHDDAPTTEEHILAIADVPPPIAMSFLTEPAVGSSMTWTLEMLTGAVSSYPLSEYRLDAELVAASGGYTSQSVMVWGPDGAPVALSRQSMVVFG
jgi:acyl-coenzyme A thioesterase PaaI-like protein